MVSVLCWFEGKTQDWKIIWLNSDVEKRRSKTAPTNGRRKNWVASSHDIKTDRGTNIRAKAPGTCKGYLSVHYDCTYYSKAKLSVVLCFKEL